MKILLTGGSGYIGSHTAVALLEHGDEVVILDNLSNSNMSAIDAIKNITNKKLVFQLADVSNMEEMRRLLHLYRPDGIIHFAGLKSVSESQEQPIQYYQTNVSGSINLLTAMDECECQNIVFSSSATVYGEANYLPYDEQHLIKPVNPYGRTKAMVEEILKDWAAASATNAAICLRYFNPIGAHESGLLGESPKNRPNNIMPYLLAVAFGEYEKFSIYGDDYNTNDGTGIRDYVHVMDLADAHVRAIHECGRQNQYSAINIGTGQGTSVKELIEAVEKRLGQRLAVEVQERRAGDVAASWADTRKAKEVLGWSSQRSIAQMVDDCCYWKETSNPLTRI